MVVVVVLLLVLLYYCTANGSSEQIFLELLLYQIGTKSKKADKGALGLV